MGNAAFPKGCCLRTCLNFFQTWPFACAFAQDRTGFMTVNEKKIDRKTQKKIFRPLHLCLTSGVSHLTSIHYVLCCDNRETLFKPLWEALFGALNKSVSAIMVPFPQIPVLSADDKKAQEDMLRSFGPSMFIARLTLCALLEQD